MVFHHLKLYIIKWSITIESNTYNISAMICILPDEILLKKLFRHFNKIYWDNLLPEVTIKWSHRMLTAGRCCAVHKSEGSMTWEIMLSWKYHMRYSGEVLTTLKHEMIHLKLPEHDDIFAKEAKRVGTRIYSHILNIPAGRYKYQCTQCHAIFYEDKINLLLQCPKCLKNCISKSLCFLEFTGIRDYVPGTKVRE
ncbi:MAG: hypothetical protein A2Y62_03575 [Candidatus Fischerbacteria bacterium RBG_13_37_8]|uniref:SprT-like domain-containing protein n=1 Tax=Candidatus Fischerbacteria bacterium RBG_13_37_8 TaxID=1817863 RepID=A0A1F5V7Z2_9BACT|nr:MAG: hypothetical protein A2Y62_03575 [Candidatus Fischerbacteria bacterium RBG_13_37_8]